MRSSGDSPDAPTGKRDKLASVQDAIAAAKEVMAQTDLSMSPGSASPEDKLAPESDPSVTAETDRDAERRDSHKAASPSQTAPEGAPKEGEGALREYRNDLEYLEDSFKLLIILLRYWASPRHRCIAHCTVLETCRITMQVCNPQPTASEFEHASSPVNSRGAVEGPIREGVDKVTSVT